jgi:hypothetical protein
MMIRTLALGVFLMATTALAVETSDFESAAARQAREARRVSLSDQLGRLLQVLREQTPRERREWHQSHRGRFFFELGDIAARLEQLNRSDKNRRAEIVAAAEPLLRHEFDILGSGRKALVPQIDWQLDFKSGFRWRDDVNYPVWSWRKVEEVPGEEIYKGHFYSLDDGSDLKMPWDLSSMFHLPVLGEAYLQTGEARYGDEVLAQLRDWHQRNPYRRGVNWTCAMVAGIRLANMIYAWHLVERHPAHAEFMGDTGLLSVVQHMKFILDFLEISPSGARNNHYLNNLVGLSFGAAEIAGSDEGRAVLDFAAKELAGELFLEFSADGTNFEGSIPYHRFATESALVTAILLDRNGRRLSSDARAQFGRMLRFIDAYTKPNGLAPQVGDNDNGRILVLHDYAKQEYRDHRHILAVGTAWLGLDAPQADLSGQSSDVIWLLGQPAPKASRPTAVASGHYPNNGFALAKTVQTYLLVRCGRINPMSGGGHNHCDQLSFEYHDLGQDLIIDPGAMIYGADPASRNGFRSTAAHNTLQLDQLEQQKFDPRDLFAMQEQAQAQLDKWQVTGMQVAFAGSHGGYASAGWKVSRKIDGDLEHGVLRVNDAAEPLAASTKGGEFVGRLHLAAGVESREKAPRTYFLQTARKKWRLRFADNVRTDLCPGKVSPSYGVTLPATVLEYRFAAQGDRKTSFSLERASP